MGEGIEILSGVELIDPKLEEFVRESERNRIISCFAAMNKTIYSKAEIFALICGFEVKDDDGMPIR